VVQTERFPKFFNPNKLLDVIKNYISAELPSFRCVREYSHPTDYWGITFSDTKNIIFLGSENDLLEYKLTINGIDLNLVDFDNRAPEQKIANKRNILFLLDRIKGNLPGNM